MYVYVCVVGGGGGESGQFVIAEEDVQWAR